MIVFPLYNSHSAYQNQNPLRAGFLSCNIDSKQCISVSCYGDSYTLGLKSDPELDTKIANDQILPLLQSRLESAGWIGELNDFYNIDYNSLINS